MATIRDQFLTLNNGLNMQSLRFGTANLGDDTSKLQAIQNAVLAGYRHFDSASMYDTETQLGLIMNNSNIPRTDFFIATKLWNSDHGFEKTTSAFHKSLTNLKIDYLDLYMTHWPVTDLRLASWDAMIDLLDRGLVRSIGVSNYTIRHLQELLDHSDVVPIINQVEFSPFLFQEELLNFCKSKRIILEAYSPLSVGRKLNNQVLSEIGSEHNKTFAQIAIKWSLTLGNSIIPRKIEQSYSGK
ncbi:MAG: aldo/keto reductase [Candidatus Heimdallarchaeota archaeon]|nr:aldo/keto reductase [Candidatus Heimdallarchaeota archaeon]